jgi:hypothetical protein
MKPMSALTSSWRPGLLTDGEMFRIIRREILKRGGKTLAKGETLVLHAPGAI